MKQKGFTIIELIVVIAIIAILAAIVMINVVGYIQRAKIVTINSDMDSVSSIALDYYTANTNYYDPNSGQNLCDDPRIVKLGNIMDNTGGSGSFSVEHYCIAGGHNPWGDTCDSDQWVMGFYSPTLGYAYCIDFTGDKTDKDYNLGWGSCTCAENIAGL